MNFNVRPSLLARMLFFVGFKLCGVVCCRGDIIIRIHYIDQINYSLKARDLKRQVANVQIRIAVFNRYNDLGIYLMEITT